MRKIKYFNIEWDSDDNDDELPSEHTIEVDSDFDPVDDGGDILSDEFGFLVASFSFSEV